jgi:hypothetical protein
MKQLSELNYEVNERLKGNVKVMTKAFETYLENQIFALLLQEPSNDVCFLNDNFSRFIDDFRMRHPECIITKNSICKMLNKCHELNNGMKCWYNTPKINDKWYWHLDATDIDNINNVKLMVAFRDVKRAETLIDGHNMISNFQG